MPTTRRDNRARLPGRYEELVRLMPPRAIMDEVQYENTIEMIDRLMTAGRLTRGQADYLETLVQLVQTYENRRHAIDLADLSGLDLLRHLLNEHGMTGADLARLLGVHPSMGSKILNGERSLTVDHLRTLTHRFALSPEAFMD